MAEPNSMFAKIYLAIIDRIKTELPADTFRYIDVERGQMEAYNPDAGGKPRISFDGILIDFEGWNFKDNGDHSQHGEGIVLLRLCFDEINPTDSLTALNTTKKGLSYLEKEQLLHEALHDWSPDEYAGYMERVGATTENRPDLYRVRQLRYSLDFTDNSTADVIVTHPVTPGVTTELRTEAGA